MASGVIKNPFKNYLYHETLTSQGGDWSGGIWIPNYISDWVSKGKRLVSVSIYSPNHLTIDNIDYYVYITNQYYDGFKVLLVSINGSKIKTYTPSTGEITFTLDYTY